MHTGSSPGLGCYSVQSHLLALHIHFLSSGIFGSYELCGLYWVITGVELFKCPQGDESGGGDLLT